MRGQRYNKRWLYSPVVRTRVYVRTNGGVFRATTGLLTAPAYGGRARGESYIRIMEHRARLMHKIRATAGLFLAHDTPIGRMTLNLDRCWSLWNPTGIKETGTR